MGTAMSSASTSGKGLTVRELAGLALMAALMVGTQVAMAALPNVNLVSVLIIVAVIAYGARALYSIAVFVALEGVIYGFGIWFISYIYAWPILALLALLLKRWGGRWLWASLAGGFGLCFGALTAIPYIFIGGWSMSLSYWVSGLGFDLIHCVSNFALAAVLVPPLSTLALKYK